MSMKVVPQALVTSTQLTGSDKDATTSAEDSRHPSRTKLEVHPTVEPNSKASSLRVFTRMRPSSLASSGSSGSRMRDEARNKPANGLASFARPVGPITSRGLRMLLTVTPPSHITHFAVLVIDVRSGLPKFTISEGTVHIACPRTLLRRPSCTLDDLQDRALSGRALAYFKERHRFDNIVVFDEDSRQLSQNASLDGMLEKLGRDEQAKCARLWFLSGGFKAFRKKFGHDLIPTSKVDSYSAATERAASTPLTSPTGKSFQETAKEAQGPKDFALLKDAVELGAPCMTEFFISPSILNAATYEDCMITLKSQLETLSVYRESALSDEPQVSSSNPIEGYLVRDPWGEVSPPFIISKTPKQEDLEGFYQHILNMRMGVLINLTQDCEVESGESGCYWPSAKHPDLGILEFGDITVDLLSCTAISLVSKSGYSGPKVIRRHVTVSDTKRSISRKVCLLQYTGWHKEGKCSSQVLVSLLARAAIEDGRVVGEGPWIVDSGPDLSRAGTLTCAALVLKRVLTELQNQMVAAPIPIPELVPWVVEKVLRLNPRMLRGVVHYATLYELILWVLKYRQE